MHTVSAKLFATNVIGVSLAWVTDAQNFFGLLGAIIGCISGLILISINWERFLASKPAMSAFSAWLRFKARYSKRNTES